MARAAQPRGDRVTTGPYGAPSSHHRGLERAPFWYTEAGELRGGELLSPHTGGMLLMRGYEEHRWPGEGGEAHAPPVRARRARGFRTAFAALSERLAASGLDDSAAAVGGAADGARFGGASAEPEGARAEPAPDGRFFPAMNSEPEPDAMLLQ